MLLECCGSAGKQAQRVAFSKAPSVVSLIGLDGITRALESAGGAFATGEVGREDARAGRVRVADALFCAN